MRKFKTLLALITVIIAALCFFCAGCGDGVNNDWSGAAFIKKAYENNYITKSDLEQIAYYHNSKQNSETALPAGENRAIRKEAAKLLNEIEKPTFFEYTDSDFTINYFYGLYSGCYVALINNPSIVEPCLVSEIEPEPFPDIGIIEPFEPSSNIYTMEIDGITFYFKGINDIIVCRFGSDKNNGGNLI